MFVHRETCGPVDVAFTNREGGVSTGPWSSLNLGTSNADDPASVQENLRLLAGALGVSTLVRMTQVHGADVHVIDTAYAGQIPTADALVTDRPGIGLLVRVADCIPILLADEAARVVAVAHGGRAGMELGVVAHTLDAMRALGAQSIRAWMGPRACGSCYEVPEALADKVAAVVPAARSTTSWGTPALDIGVGIRSQFAADDVKVTDIGEDLCTIEDDSFFSYRRQGADSGRFGAVVVLR